MKTTVTRYAFYDAFKAIRPNNFSYDGLDVLFEYLEQLEEDTGAEIELDVVGLCCDFAERSEAVLNYLESEGCLVGETTEGTFVYRLH